MPGRKEQRMGVTDSSCSGVPTENLATSLSSDGKAQMNAVNEHLPKTKGMKSLQIS